MNQQDYDGVMDVIGAAVRLLCAREAERLTDELHDGGNSIIRDHQQHIAEMGAENARLRHGLRKIMGWYETERMMRTNMTDDEMERWRAQTIEDAGLLANDIRVLR